MLCLVFVISSGGSYLSLVNRAGFNSLVLLVLQIQILFLPVYMEGISACDKYTTHHVNQALVLSKNPANTNRLYLQIYAINRVCFTSIKQSRVTDIIFKIQTHCFNELNSHQANVRGRSILLVDIHNINIQCIPPCCPCRQLFFH